MFCSPKLVYTYAGLCTCDCTYLQKKTEKQTFRNCKKHMLVNCMGPKIYVVSKQSGWGNVHLFPMKVYYIIDYIKAFIPKSLFSHRFCADESL